MRTRRLAVLAILGMVAVTAPRAGAGPSLRFERNIKVGIVDTYSGPPAVFGNDALNGFRLALEEINREGVHGARIEFVTRDEKFSPEIGLSMARELVLQERVDLLVGTISSATALAISAFAREQRVPFLVWISKSEQITGAKGHRYVFSTSENTAMAGKALAYALARRGYTRFWIGAEDYEYGHAVTNSFWRFMKRAKPEATLLGQTWWRTGEPDLVPYLTQILQARPDAAFFGTGGAGMANVLRTMKVIGFAERVPSAIHTAIDVTVLRPLGAAAPEDVWGTTDYLFYYPETPANREFVRRFQTAYRDPPGFPAFHGYITAHFIAEAYRRARSLDRERFIEALEGLRIRTPVGEVEMRACDHQATLPLFFGRTKRDPQFPFLVAGDLMTVPAREVMPTCEDIQRARTQGR
ncbi:MAG: ABC transporter substrate-binding protein [Armatimonadota bacterium]|nr:ABC transporter substrate-binding protein [Armatimonadota bacterium]MDR7445010.1 ABC transporter substrate-binding protein [Armatimonadota bacterium]MDR7570096.1 ABC transporter substrate-binding protein [Armatimonadota bacterium]MDR7614698.1 ABC transporter substrate-binding protein [Armatimonadota bacterium]